MELRDPTCNGWQGAPCRWCFFCSFSGLQSPDCRVHLQVRSLGWNVQMAGSKIDTTLVGFWNATHYKCWTFSPGDLSFAKAVTVLIYVSAIYWVYHVPLITGETALWFAGNDLGKPFRDLFTSPGLVTSNWWWFYWWGAQFSQKFPKKFKFLGLF